VTDQTEKEGSMLTFTPISPGQARALGRLGSLNDPLPKLIVANDRDNDCLIVVPASRNDRRRWDITKGGKIIKRQR